jgi:F420-0:gamma-glutamyl ligase
VESQIGRPDLYGKPLHITEKAVADDLASTAVLVTGEAGESTPFALIRGAPITFTDRAIDPREVLIEPKIDLYAGIYSEEFRNLLEA